MFYSHRKSGQPGPITRIMCCTPEEYERLPVGCTGQREACMPLVVGAGAVGEGHSQRVVLSACRFYFEAAASAHWAVMGI